MKITGQIPEKLKSDLVRICAEVFFPQFDQATRDALTKLRYSDNAYPIFQKAGLVYDSPSAQKVRLFSETASHFANSFDWWLGGLDEDALAAFPAQELTLIIREAKDARAFPKRWALVGGKVFGKKMIALKWDSIWSKISAFDLPFPPFQLDSGYEVRDIDYREAKSLKLPIPLGLTTTLNLNVNLEDFRKRLIQEIDRVELAKAQI